MNLQGTKQKVIEGKPQSKGTPSGSGMIIENHPLASSAGVFANDPLWDEFLQAMEEARREEDAADPMNE